MKKYSGASYPKRNCWAALLDEVIGKRGQMLDARFINVPEKLIKKNSLRGKIVQYYLPEVYESFYLTQREADCLYHLLNGKTIVKTAAELGLSSRTVEYYVKNIKAKLNCRKKSQVLDVIRNTRFMKVYLKQLKSA